MEYIWIIMLVIADLIWLIASISNVIEIYNYLKEAEGNKSLLGYIGQFISDLEGFAAAFVVMHLLALFFVSFVAFFMSLAQ